MSQQKERQTDALKSQQAINFIDSGFGLFNKPPHTAVHMDKNIETVLITAVRKASNYLLTSTSQHGISSQFLDSHNAATGMFARATFRDKDKNTQQHSGEYKTT